MMRENGTYDFGLRLKKLRRKKKLSQAQLAAKLNVTKSSISAYERNISIPPAETIKQLALIFNVTTDYLLGMNNRRVIVLDGLSEEHAQIVEDVATLLIQEFRTRFRYRNS